MLKDKKIILGVCGGIAAYKTATVTRLLKKAGAQVKVVMTPAAHDFITPLTLATLSGNPALTEFATQQTGEWNNHVELGLWADALLIAPATASTMAKMAHGLGDELLLAVYLSARCPVFFAPAMDLDMLQHPSTQRNIETLTGYGNHLIPPAFGELASGLTGPGRMAEPQEIVDHLNRFFHGQNKLKGKKALVTAGPTYEAIDPVRFIGNHSTGKMGFAIAEALADQGADVHLVAGPTAERTHHPGIRLTAVTTAREMFDACVNFFEGADITVLSAAVADYKPEQVASQKIKKKTGDLTLALTRTDDIAETLGKRKHNGQLLVGFALETEQEEAHALKKLEAKNFDLIVLNSLNDRGAGFGHDTNKVTILDKEKRARTFGLKSKKKVADDIVDAILEKMHA